MADIWLGDVLAAARVLWRTGPCRRNWVLERMLREAARADAHRRATGRAHPRWGDGSLMAAALRRHPPGAPPFGDRTYRRMLVLVLQRLDRRPAGKA